MTEEWRPIEGYPGYWVSDQGQVIGPKGHLLKRSRFTNGYLMVTLYLGGVRKHRSVHRLVLETFVGPPGPGQECRHLNGNPEDDRLVNLAWGTPKENTADSLAHGTNRNARKTHCKRGHEFTEENTYHQKRGRMCRACHRAADKAYRAQRGLSK